MSALAWALVGYGVIGFILWIPVTRAIVNYDLEEGELGDEYVFVTLMAFFACCVWPIAFTALMAKHLDRRRVRRLKEQNDPENTGSPPLDEVEVMPLLASERLKRDLHDSQWD